MPLLIDFRRLVETRPHLTPMEYLHLLGQQMPGAPVNPLRFKTERAKAHAIICPALDAELADVADRVFWYEKTRFKALAWAEAAIAVGRVKPIEIEAPPEPTAEETSADLRLLREETDRIAQGTDLAHRVPVLTKHLVEMIGQPWTEALAIRVMNILASALNNWSAEKRVSNSLSLVREVYEARIGDINEKHTAQLQLLGHDSGSVPARPNGSASSYRPQTR